MNVEDEQGWVPSTCLEREDGQKEDTTLRFEPGEGTGITFTAVLVLYCVMSLKELMIERSPGL